jgi:F0F1-type ATP synthase membrane subunit c/vacuolar-type H+-ATPase subunit K
MSTETSERQDHLRAITITSLTAFAGVGAALGSAVLTSDLTTSAAVNADLPKVLVLAAIALQVPIYQFVYDDWGGAKDVLFVGFMTFCFWFVTFAIVLQTRVFH